MHSTASDTNTHTRTHRGMREAVQTSDCATTTTKCTREKKEMKFNAAMRRTSENRPDGRSQKQKQPWPRRTLPYQHQIIEHK